MKRIILPVVLLLLFSAFSADQQQTVPLPFGLGEYLLYRVHYGFINAGEAKMQVDDKLYMVNGKVCYKAFVIGATTGAFDMATHVRDSWATYLDTANRTPQRAFRDIAEGKYRLRESMNYDYNNNQLTVEREGSDKKAVSYKVPSEVQDIVSGFFYLRGKDYSRYKIGDTISMNAFLEDRLYSFKVRYTGKDKVETKFGDINCIRLNPVMDKNGMFEGGNSIRFWISDDNNKIPIRIEADMWVGKVAMDLKSYKNMKYPLRFEK